MAGWYNLAGYGNATSMFQIVDTTNTLTNQLFSIMFILITVLLIMVILWQQDVPTKILIASIVATFEAIIFTAMGMFGSLLTVIAILVLAILWNTMQKKEG